MAASADQKIAQLAHLRTKWIQDLRDFARSHSILNGPHIATPELDVDLLLSFILNCRREELFLDGERILTSEEQEKMVHFLTRRKKGEPVSKIIGLKGFWKFDFKVSKDVLDPRPDSEILIESLLLYYEKRPSPRKILDLGVGSGCLLLSLLAEFEEAKGFGVDLSEKALEIALQNALRFGLERRVIFQKGNWFEGLLEDSFDLIISNPPYIEEKKLFALSQEVKNYDPVLALIAGEDGLDAYRSIIQKLALYLKKGGVFCFEIGYSQKDAVSQLLKEAGFKYFQVIKDLAGQDRCILGEY